MPQEFDGIATIVTGDNNRVTDYGAVAGALDFGEYTVGRAFNFGDSAFDFASRIADASETYFNKAIEAVDESSDDAIAFAEKTLHDVTSNQQVQAEASKNQRYLMIVAGAVIVAVVFLRR